MKKDRKVEEQLGPIDPRGMNGSRKAVPQLVKAMRQMAENAMIYSNQILELHEPKQ